MHAQLMQRDIDHRIATMIPHGAAYLALHRLLRDITTHTRTQYQDNHGQRDSSSDDSAGDGPAVLAGVRLSHQSQATVDT